MNLKPKEIYHFYNRGINRQPIFFERDNYFYFLKKVKTYLVPNCHILGFSLMPNHFHFLITPNERSNRPFRKSNRKPLKKRKGPFAHQTLFTWGLQQLLSTYSRGINKRYNRTGSLFQQNTKSKMTSAESLQEDYSLYCFMYIHNNAVAAGLVNSPSEYEFTSYNDYIENKTDSICNLALGKELLSLDLNEFEFQSSNIPTEIIKKIF
ncbi:MAG: hypothetical protein WBP41_02795 [Saprospiraceae bacterium]